MVDLLAGFILYASTMQAGKGGERSRKLFVCAIAKLFVGCELHRLCEIPITTSK
ncbi:MAG: hypothetical protein KME31_04395 [Tolypothrix carrinoi HA7290-LM1]|nr:hypothetical protein [Tolypothrix carrinoi HA7290-LM1]